MTVYQHSDEATSWGRVRKPSHYIARPRFEDEIFELFRDTGNTSRILPSGMSRSYGDSSQNANGRLVKCTGLDRILAFDDEHGVIRVQSGVTLDDLLNFIVPCGWFLKVTPGTRYITVGGAVANDIHGKNHHVYGTFGGCISKIGLIRSDSGALELSKDDPLFSATIGGLGLTGIIMWVEFDLLQISNSQLTVQDIPFANISEFFTLDAESMRDWDYTVSWIDCMKSGSRLARGILSRANHSKSGSLKVHSNKTSLNVPFEFPSFLLNKITITTFNLGYFYWRSRQTKPRQLHYSQFQYPLDHIGNWNRGYGKKGMYQYQCVIPKKAAQDATAELLKQIAKSGLGSFLVVLKSFGDKQSPGMLSFPTEGTTLALDFPNKGARTLELLISLDDIVRESGGRLYPAKDARISGKMFRHGYPHWEQFAKLTDPKFRSDFWKRVSTGSS